MVKHTKTIRRLLSTNCLSVFDHFVLLALKGLTQFRSYDLIPSWQSIFKVAIKLIYCSEVCFIDFGNNQSWLSCLIILFNYFPASIYLHKVNSRNARKRCEICSKLTIKIPERHHWRRSGIFIVNLKHISHLFLLLTLGR